MVFFFIMHIVFGSIHVNSLIYSNPLFLFIEIDEFLHILRSRYYNVTIFLYTKIKATIFMYLNLFKNVSQPNLKIVVHLETIIGYLKLDTRLLCNTLVGNKVYKEN